MISIQGLFTSLKMIPLSRAFPTSKKEIPAYISANFLSLTKMNNNEFSSPCNQESDNVNFLTFNLKVSILKVMDETIIHKSLNILQINSIKHLYSTTFKNILLSLSGCLSTLATSIPTKKQSL